MRTTTDKFISAEELIKKLPRRVTSEVIAAAQQFNCEVYAVGGCVRDLIIKRSTTDIDFAVVGDAQALAGEVARRLAAAQVSVYARFGTALIQTSQGRIEFATARRESYQPDSRKPAKVSKVPIDDDLIRRDFTINAIALGLVGPRKGELIDLFGGVRDLKRKILRTPAEPNVTFCDDPLRILRGVRFAAEFGLTIEPATWEGMHCNAQRLAIVASERIGDEFMKILSGSNPVHSMELMLAAGIMKIILPEVAAMGGVEQISRHNHKDVLLHSLKVMQNLLPVTNDPILRLAGLLHDIGKPRTKRFDQLAGWTFHGHEVVGARMAGQIGRRLHIPKEQVNRLVKLVRLHMRPINLTDDGVTDSAIRRLMVDASDDLDALLALCRADITTSNPDKVERYLNNFGEIVQRMSDVEARDRMRHFQSPVNGVEIMELCGLEPGPYVGALKERIEDAILDGVIPYEYQAARDYLMSIKNEVLAKSPAELIAEMRERSIQRRNITGNFNFPVSE